MALEAFDGLGSKPTHSLERLTPSSLTGRRTKNISDQIELLEKAIKTVLTEAASTSADIRRAFNAFNELKSILAKGESPNAERQKVQELFFDNINLQTRESVMKMFLMQTELHEAAIKSVAFHNAETDLYKELRARALSTDATLARAPYSVHFHLGILGKETEPLNLSQVKALSLVSELLHQEECSETELTNAVDTFWAASYSSAKDSETEIQLHYAIQIYRSLSAANNRIHDILQRANSSATAPTGWLNLFTWLRGDVDGRPYETTKDTEKLLKDLRAQIFKLYHADVSELAKNFSKQLEVVPILNRLNPDSSLAYGNPNSLVQDIQQVFGVDAGRDLTSKIAAFGFHFVQIELRQNANAIAAAIDELIPPDLIAQQLNVPPTRYLNLSNPQRSRLLTLLQARPNQEWPQKLYAAFKGRRETYLNAKAKEHAHDSYFSIATHDPQYIKVLDIDNCFERVLLAARFPESIRLHGIAETKSAADVLGLLFVNSAIGNSGGLDIAMQPEDPAGAENLLAEVKQIYTNPVYREHLRRRGNIQYLTCGPSDTGKSGGKAMHKANAVIASKHRDIAKMYGVELIVHPIIGYEHSRGNSPFANIVKEHDAISSFHTRFTIAGLREMRSQFGAQAHTAHVLSDMFLAHLQNPLSMLGEGNSKDERIAEWFEGIKSYERLFFQHPSLPAFLKEAARFDVLSFSWKGQRPLARDRDIPVESDPPAIRAIPFSRAMMMAGLFPEGLGGSVLEKHSAEAIRKRAQEDMPFRDYLKSLAYAASRCDLDHAWRTLGLEAPLEGTRKTWANLAHAQSGGQDEARNLLAAIHEEVVAVRQILAEVYPGGTGNFPLLSKWPTLAEEVSFRERSLRLPKYLLETGRVKAPLFSPQLVKDLSAMYISLVNTAVAFVHTDQT